jgi:signal transduction histidine kinase
MSEITIKNTEQTERRQFIQQFSVTGIMVLLMSSVPDLYYKVWDTVLYSIVAIFIFLLVFILNKKYSYQWVGLLAITVFSVMLLFLSKVAGYHAKASLFYIPLTITVPLFISYEKKTIFYAGLAIPIFLGISAENLPVPIPTSPDMTMEKQEVYARVNFILCLVFSPFLAFKVVSFHYKQRKLLEKSEQELAQKNKELIKINQELDRFIYSLSHDLRSPIASAIGLIWLAKDETDVEQLKSYFAMQEKGLKRLDNFIQEVLNYAKNNHQEIVVKQVQIKEITDDIVLYLKQNPEYEHITVNLEICQECIFFSDSFRIKVILQNLISNAFQYRDTNKSTNEVKIIFTCDKDKAYFEIWDNGVGIPENYQNRVFDMFFRANNAVRGTGLGLYIVKDAIEKLCGEITLQSREKEYTKFSFTVPNHIKL